MVEHGFTGFSCTGRGGTCHRRADVQHQLALLLRHRRGGRQSR